MSIPGNAPRRNPYRDPSAYWPDGVPPVGSHVPGSQGIDGLVPDGRRRGEVARRGEPAPSSAQPHRRNMPRRAPKPLSRLATVLGAISLGFGIMALTLGVVPWIGAFLSAGPLAASALAAWGSFARSKVLAARVSAMAVAGAALSVLHVVMLFVR
ncbi:hypothetical protein GCM10027449_05510 [Sinomonas notoginsengisoli]|uniref:hypothetical protein n=1 Tax=Sinomonas notoginsengisoli TaxID=1457311 RepID=UPI001F306A06|nr:hypothetical protein [Sinomonas notoginsengisoli]